MEVVLEVTQDDIDRGAFGVADSCAIALAIRRELMPNIDKAAMVLVGPSTIFISDKNNKTLATAKMPEEAWRFMDRFDAELPVDPITMELTVNILNRGKEEGS